MLTGTELGLSLFHPGDGCDFVTTGGGSDTGSFLTINRRARRFLTIADFDPLADTLDVRGAAVA